MHSIPITTGELLDRISILEIKIANLPYKAAQECVKEYNQIVVDIIQPDHKYYYKLLVNINKQIWNIQEKLHDGMGEPIIDYARILELNDRRCRVKEKIDIFCKSEWKEQKSYSKKKCVVYGHLGMGDMYWMNGAVRFLSTIYDEVVVPCKTRNVHNTTVMYNDDPSIKVWPIPCQVDIEDITKHLSEHVMIACGLAAKTGAENYPDSFYTDMGLDPIYRTEYFHHASTPESEILADQIHEPFILIHEDKSSSHFDITSNFNPDNILIFNIQRNIYSPGHKYYELANYIIKKPLYCYIELLKKAKELHLIESSLACLACHLDLSRVKVKKIYEASPNFLNLGVFEKG